MGRVRAGWPVPALVPLVASSSARRAWSTAVHAVAPGRVLAEHFRHARQLHRHDLAELELALDEALERRVPLRFVQAELPDLLQLEPDVEEGTGQIPLQGADALQRVVQLGNPCLQLLGARGHPQRGPGAARPGRLGVARLGLCGVLWRRDGPPMARPRADR